MHSGAVKDFDMKNKQIVREAKAGGAHKSAICCLTSFGKWLVSVSSDNIVIYDYQAMKEHSNFSISGDTDLAIKMDKQESLNTASIFKDTGKDSAMQIEYILVGTSKG